ncbi:MAG: ABC transporter permease [Promethearchaeota archaeon]
MKVLKYTLQDLKRQKVKTTFAILGIFVSVLLLTLVGSLSDSLAYSNLDQATYEVGSADIVFQKQMQQDLNFNQYFPQNIIETQLNNITEISHFYPRIQTILSISFIDPSLENATVKRMLISYGLNSTAEQESNQLGTLWECEETNTNDKGELLYDRTSEIFKGPIPEEQCIVTAGTARLFHLQSGDTLSVKTAGKTTDLIVFKIVDPDLRFSRFETALVITDLSWMQTFLKEEGKVNTVLATLNHPEMIYNTRNLRSSTIKLQGIGQKIQEIIGFDYQVQLPKLTQLESSSQQMDFMNMTFYFIIIFSTIITGILINSILTTSVEERIREFGVLQVVGAKRKFTFKMVLLSGTMMGIIGTIAGTIIGTFVGPPLLNWLFTTVFPDVLTTFKITFIILPITAIRSLILGIVVTMVISIFPAFTAGKTNLADAIDPGRNTGNKQIKYHLKKEGSANLKLMGIGLGIAATGIFIFLVLPRIITGSGGPSLTNYIFTALLMLVLIGLVLVTIGFVPVIEALIANIFKPFIKKYYPVYRINLVRYRRRNIGNILMFAMTFSFIFFISTSLEMQTINNSTLFRFEYGGDLVLSNTGTIEDSNALDLKLVNEIRDLPGVAHCAPIDHNSFDFTKITWAMSNAGEEGVGNFNMGAIFGTIPKLSATIGDLGDYNNYYCSLVGIDDQYYDTVDHSLILWDRTTHSSDKDLQTLIQTRNNCIIAKSFADAMGITELPAQVRITMFDSENPDLPFNVSIFNVIGVSQGIPGVWNFRSNSMSLFMGAGVLLNMEDYAQLMQWGDPSSENFEVDKILIKMVDNSDENIRELKEFISNYYSENYEFIIDEPYKIINYMNDVGETTNTIMQIILFFSILVSLFGLIASMYSTILERMFELGILRAMGLRPRELRNMLMAEAVTVMVSSGMLGAIVGWFIAYLLQYNVSILTEMPAATAINVGTLIFTFLTSIGISIIGMFFITRKVEKMQVIDVLRSTF